MMRVLHLLEATAGGTRRHVLDLLPPLQARGVHCTLIYSAARNPLFRRDAALLQGKNIETYEIPMGHRWERRTDFSAVRLLHAHLQTHNYDLVHCHSSNAGLLGRLANMFQKHKAPLIYTPHYVAFAAGVPRLQRRGALYFEKLLASQTTLYIAVSHHEYSLLRRVLKLGARRAVVIHNGINAEAWRNGTGHSAPRTSQFEIGCFGRLTTQKNQRLLVRALPRLAQDIPGVHLKLVGGGEDESTLHALAIRLGCDDRVHFHQEVLDPHDDYYACDIVAQPSRWEGCSYALLEAAAAARCIVASNAGGTPEVLGDAGVLLPAHDEAAWTRALLQLLRDEPQRRVLGQAARERVATHFRLEAMVEKTLGVYKRVLQ